MKPAWLFLRCLLVLGLVGSMLGCVGNVDGPSATISVRSWAAPDGQDTLEAAQQALAPLPAADGPAEFHTRPFHPVWFALTLPASTGATPMVLDLTHGAVRHAALYQTGADGQVTMTSSGMHAGQTNPDARFPATFVLPASNASRTVWLRLNTSVVTRGEFRWLPLPVWQQQSRWLFNLMAACFGVALMAAGYALVRALSLRSTAYGLYGLVAFSLFLTGVAITGYGSGRYWPQLIPWRGEISAAMACISAGLVLMLARHAFALEVSVPRWSAALRGVGLGCVLFGLGGSVLSLQAYQTLSHLAALTAGVMGVASVWLAHRTGNPVAIWLLAGFTPVMLGAFVTTLGIAGALSFEPWMLLAMPLGGVLEVPFNLYGLSLLERRRALVRQSLSKIAGGQGRERESRAALLRRLASGSGAAQPAAVKGVLTLMRFEGLAPGEDAPRRVDRLHIERYLHSMMALAVRPGNQVGRWSQHELVVYDPQFRSDLMMRDFVSALFAQALRCEAFDLQPGEICLRIAHGSLDSPEATLETGLSRLSRALDNPKLADTRRITLNLATGTVLWPRPARKRLSPA